MTNRAIKGASLSVFLALVALACSPSSSRPVTERADARAQEVREDENEIPCEPRLILQTVCQQCHALTPRGGAPFPLVRRSDVLAIRSGVVVRELMIQQLGAGRMPLTPVTLDPEAREVLLDWLRAGAPAVTPSRCDAPDAEAPGDPVDASTDTIAYYDGGCTSGCFDAQVDAGSDGEADAAPE